MPTIKKTTFLFWTTCSTEAEGIPFKVTAWYGFVRQDYHVLRGDDDDGGDALLPGELPEELVVDVERALSRDVRVGHVVPVDEGKQDGILPAQGIHAEPGEFT